MENWQSEYLQFSLFILGTIWLLQRGSPESKELDQAGRESDQEQKVGEHADPRSPRWAGRRPAHVHLLELAAARDDRDLPRLVVRPVGDRLDRVQRQQVEHEQPELSWVGYLGSRRLLADDAPELAVGVPRRRLDGDPRPSTCASAAHRSPSRSAPPTTPRPSRAKSALRCRPAAQASSARRWSRARTSAFAVDALEPRVPP